MTPQPPSPPAGPNHNSPPHSTCAGTFHIVAQGKIGVATSRRRSLEAIGVAHPAAVPVVRTPTAVHIKAQGEVPPGPTPWVARHQESPTLSPPARERACLTPDEVEALQQPPPSGIPVLKPNFDPRTRCSCGRLSYTGGWCFGCGHYRQGKHARVADERDSAERQAHSFGSRLWEFPWPPNDWNE